MQSLALRGEIPPVGYDKIALNSTKHIDKSKWSLAGLRCRMYGTDARDLYRYQALRVWISSTHSIDAHRADLLALGHVHCQSLEILLGAGQHFFFAQHIGHVGR